jgi:hypothetical protein
MLAAHKAKYAKSADAKNQLALFACVATNNMFFSAKNRRVMPRQSIDDTF